MKLIQLQGRPGVMACDATGIPAFPGGSFTLAYPEAIGDSAQPTWYGDIRPTWEENAGGTWTSAGSKPGELDYEITLTPGTDHVTSQFKLTNLSQREWRQGMAFNCFQCAKDNSIRDNECLRTWVRAKGRFRRLVELPRVFGPRPALQLYSVEGAPPGKDIPFVAGFAATPEVVIEPWMAIVSRDGRRLAATVSRPGLFLFQNREYSCIHCATGFGSLSPGQSADAVNTVYFVEATLADWYQRMKSELTN
jgi:hypothetical protein